LNLLLLRLFMWGVLILLCVWLMIGDALCDSYIVNSIHDATKSYYERGKHGLMDLSNIKFPLFMLQILKLHLFYLTMFATMCLVDLFSYKIPMHRKWFRFKCVSYLLFDSLSCFKVLYSAFSLSCFMAPTWASFQITAPSSKALKKSTLGG
jgi:polyferredoxin